MKKLITLLLFAFTITLIVEAQTYMRVHQSNGEVASFDTEEIDSVDFNIVVPPPPPPPPPPPCSKCQPDIPVTDIDGNVYATVRIGDQIWMAENLRTTHYPDGTAIPFINNDIDWGDLDPWGEAYCWSNDDISMSVNGAYYTFYAALGGLSGPLDIPGQGVCPAGWHIPTEYEYSNLNDFIRTDNGGTYIPSEVLGKDGPNLYGSNDYGFSAIGIGFRRNIRGDFFGDDGYYSGWWATQNSPLPIPPLPSEGIGWYFFRDEPSVNSSSYIPNAGLPVRCIKD